MLEPTSEQRTALEGGEPVSCVVAQTACVVVRQDVFDRLQRIALANQDAAVADIFKT